MNGRTNTTAVGFNKGVSIPLEAPTGFSGTSGDRTATITWTDPVNKYANPGGELVSDWSYDVVVRKLGSAPTNPDDGEQIFRTTLRDQCATEPYVDSNLTNDQKYYYGIYAYNQFGLESEGLVGSVIPSYYASIKYSRSLSSGITVDYDTTCISGANNAFAFFIGMGMGSFNVSTFNSDLVRGSLTPAISSYVYAYARVSNNAIFYGNNTIAIDGNCIQTQLPSGTFSNPNGIISSADVDHKCAYAFAYPNPSSYSGTVQQGFRYNQDLVVTNIGALPSVSSWNGRSLSSKHYAMIGGFATSTTGGTSYNHPESYLFDENGTRTTINTPLARGDEISTSRCDDNILIFGGSDSTDRSDTNNAYGVTKDLVVSKIGSLTSISFAKSYDAQTTGLGAAPHNSGVDHYDKHMVNQGKISGTSSNMSGYEIQIPRIGNYILIGSSNSSSVYAFENV